VVVEGDEYAFARDYCGNEHIFVMDQFERCQLLRSFMCCVLKGL
jgi:hypothetical protein